jgi:hypothetical protein
MAQVFKAGGVILYDDTGIWIIKERLGWNVPGGDKDSKDKDIYHTMAREFNEETYHAFPMTADMLKTLGKSCPHVYYPFRRDYLYITIHINDLPFQFTHSLVKYNKMITRGRCTSESTEFMHVTHTEIIHLFASMHIRLQRLVLSDTIPFSIRTSACDLYMCGVGLSAKDMAQLTNITKINQEIYDIYIY